MIEKHRQADAADAGKGASRRRSIAIAVLLALMVAIFYATTIVRLGGNVANKVM